MLALLPCPLLRPVTGVTVSDYYINLQVFARHPVACVIPCVRFSHDVSPSIGLQVGLRVHVANAVPPTNFQWVSCHVCNTR